MWFNPLEYPNFIYAYSDAGLVGTSWRETFKAMGFKTHRFGFWRDFYDGNSWLDEHEFTFFVLRFS